jgi:DNA mismatch endonuclease, patch repair protein
MPPPDKSGGKLATVTDFLSKETRSKVMSRIRSRDTLPELALRRSLFAAGVRGWRCHTKSLPGKPDLAFARWKVAVFVDGCFWHGHPDFFTPGKSGAYWDAKIARTQERDRHANELLAAQGWTVLRFWDFEVEDQLDACTQRVIEALSAARGLVAA